MENSLGFAVPRNAKATEKKPKKVYKVSKYKKIKTDDGLILSRANIFQYRYYNDDKKILKRLREAYVKPIKELSTQRLLEIFNSAENVDKIVIKSIHNLSSEIFAWPKVKRVQQSIFENNEEAIFCTWEVLDENKTPNPIKNFYAINAKIINNLSADYIYAPFVDYIDSAVFDNPNLKKIFVGPDFKIANIPNEQRRFLENYSTEELSAIYLLNLYLAHTFNAIIKYANSIKCPTEVDKQKWKSLKETIDNIKLIMEKKIEPFSFFISPL